MNILTVNLAEKMIKHNRKVLKMEIATLQHQSNLDAEIEKLRVNAETTFKEGKKQEVIDAARLLGFDYKVTEAAEINNRNNATKHLPQDSVFTTEAIRKICCTYGLRFLPTKLYKGVLDDKIPAKLEEFKKLNGGKMPDASIRTVDAYDGFYRDNHYGPSFFIAAPTSSFVLQERPKDPLLFVYLGNDRWYLIHKWGNDLNIFARIANWHWNVIGGILGIMTFGTIVGMFVKYLTNDNGAATAGVIIAAFVALVIAGAAGLLDANQKTVTAKNWNNNYKN